MYFSSDIFIYSIYSIYFSIFLKEGDVNEFNQIHQPQLNEIGRRLA